MPMARGVLSGPCRRRDVPPPGRMAARPGHRFRNAWQLPWLLKLKLWLTRAVFLIAISNAQG